MAFVHGSAGRSYFNGLDLSPFIHTHSLSGTIEASEATVLTSDAKEYTVGQRDRTFSAEGYYHADATAIVEAALGVSGGVLTYCPGGASAVGDLAWLSSVIGTTYAPSDEISGTVAFAFDAQTSGLTAFGYVLHPLGEDTNTTTGADRDDGAATATGWTAHLHVPSAPDGGSWVIKLQDAATTDWADVTGGAFTAVTGATSQRLQSAASTTALRRHVRYVATRTGGSAGDGITFLLAISRQA